MEVLLKWSKDIATNIDKIDDQHKNLFSIMNQLAKIYKRHEEYNEILKIINELLRYSVEHFNAEYLYMAENEYPSFNNHMKEHEDFIKKLEDFIKGFEEERETLTKEMLIFLKDWWIDHISKSDMNFANWMT